MSGGGTFAKYYANIGYIRSGDFLKVGEAENNYTDRLNVRGNIDLRLNDFITASVDANVTFYNAKSAVGDNYWSTAATLRPNRVSPLIPMSYLDANAVAAHQLLGTTDNRTSTPTSTMPARSTTCTTSAPCWWPTASS